MKGDRKTLIKKDYSPYEFLVQSQESAPPYSDSQEDKAFYIQQGKVEFELDDWTIVATSGTLLHSLKGQLHRFTNLGSETAKMLCWNLPAGLEKFFAEAGVNFEDLSVPLTLVSSEDIEKLLATTAK
jgi:mannose-6-phosphate isomerase-like protein (cupin superfamily)